MRKFALAVTAVAALSAGLQTPAFAAAPDAPTDLTVDWQAGKVHLTWKDNGEANEIYAEYVDSAQTVQVMSVTASDGNDVALLNGLNPADRVRLIVKSVNADGLSEGTATTQFDTRRAVAPALQDANLAVNLTTQLKWTQATVADKTPGDPLDLPATSESLKAWVDLPGTATQSYTFDAGTTSATIPAQARPAAIKLGAVNEWGESADVKTVRLGTLGAGTTVPTQAVYGARLGIKSTLDLFTSEGREERASGIKVELQARAKTTDAWKTYGRYAGNTTAAFDTGIASLGNRQYRLWVPARKVVSGNVIALTPASSTSAKSSKTFVNYAGSGFSPSTGRIGTRWTFTVKVQPAVTVQGKLQFWDGRAWFDAGPLPITKGSYVERGGPETERLSIRLRVTVPTVVVNGLTVNATTSSAYNLTIR